jgi:anti-anti-sigma factor
MKQVYEFASYHVDPEKRLLLQGDKPVPLTSKAFETLLLLLQNSHRVVSKDDLIKTLWPDSFVQESNLTQNIFVLRKALGETAQDHRYIVTVPGKGYQFAEPVRLVSQDEVELTVGSHHRLVGDFGAQPVAQLRQLELQRKRIEPDVVLVQIVGRIVHGPECQQIEWLIAELISEGERKIIFDISHVRHLDSAGVGIVVMCSGKVREAGGELRVAGAEGHVKTVLKTTEVEKIVPLYPTMADALEGFAGTAV